MTTDKLKDYEPKVDVLKIKTMADSDLTIQDILKQLWDEDFDVVYYTVQNLVNLEQAETIEHFEAQLVQVETMLAVLCQRQEVFSHQAAILIAASIEKADKRLLSANLSGILKAIEKSSSTDVVEYLLTPLDQILSEITQTRAKVLKVEIESCILALLSMERKDLAFSFLCSLAFSVGTWRVGFDVQTVTSELNQIFDEETRKITQIKELIESAAEETVEEFAE